MTDFKKALKEEEKKERKLKTCAISILILSVVLKMALWLGLFAVGLLIARAILNI
jgi:hypothetical protein